MLYLLFGEMGVGKNYVGEKLADYLGCKFYDGDLSIPDDMKERVKNFRFLPDKMIDRFVVYLMQDIHYLLRDYGMVVVSQALYKREYRREIWKHFPTARQIHVVPPSLRVHLSRILERPRGYRWALYCLLSKPFFQKPYYGDVIVNDNYESVMDQIEALRCWEDG